MFVKKRDSPSRYGVQNTGNISIQALVSIEQNALAQFLRKENVLKHTIGLNIPTEIR